MAASWQNLVEGSTYELNSSAVNDKSRNQTVLHVKLTESALKAIEEFQKLKGADKRATIKFDGNQGVIRIQGTSGGGDADEDFKKFGFLVSSVYGGQDGSFECIKQIGSTTRGRGAGSSSLESIGVMTHKLTVQASDDVYQKTLVKMSLAEEESKKARAKEIKSSGTNNMPQRMRNISNNVNNSLASRGSVKNVLARRSAGSTAPSSVIANHNPPKSNNSAINNSVNNAANKNSDIKNIPIRDRIIHLLALKTYTKPELLLRLKRDGITEKDKAIFGPILNQVASLNLKENNYTLHRHVCNDVSADWPFYSEEDKLQLSRVQIDMLTDEVKKFNHELKKLLTLQTTLASDTPVISPCHSVTGQGDTSPNSQAKRRRIAHTRKEAIPTSTGGASVSPPPVGPAKVGRLRGRPSISGDVSCSEKLNGSITNNQNSPNCDDLNQPDYLLNYVTITSPEQKKRYRRDFDSQYDEYCHLREIVFPHTQTFEEFDKRLRQHTPGSQPYEKLKQDVLEEYSKLKSNTKYINDRQRLEYLHNKLTHIKKLVQDYNSSNKT